MPSNRKLALLALIFFVVMAAAISLWRWGRPESPNQRAIPEALAMDIQKISINYKDTPVVLDSKSEQWGQLVDALAKIELGSVISENDAKYSNFELDPAQASHVIVHVSSRTEPILDMYVGKSGEIYNEAYVRLFGSKQVRLAQNCPVHLFRQPPDSYRLKTENQKVSPFARAIPGRE